MTIPMEIRAAPDEDKLTHHMKLSDGATELGIILCDSKGEPDPRPIRQSGVPRTGLQFRQGDPDYSDYELPYVSHTQKDWSGGRGNEHFEKDKTRYIDSFNLDTSAGDIVLAPRPQEVLLGTMLPPFASYGYPPEALGGSNYVQEWRDEPFTPNFLHDYKTNRNYYWKNINAGEYISSVTWAKRFQYTSTYPLESVTIYVATCSRLQVSIVKCSTLPTTNDQKDALVEACVSGQSNESYGYEVVATTDVYDDAKRAEDSFITIPLRATLVQNEYYMLAVTSEQTQYSAGWMTTPDGTIYLPITWWGIQAATKPYFSIATLSGLSIQAVRGSWTGNWYTVPEQPSSEKLTSVYEYDEASGLTFSFYLNSEGTYPGRTLFFKYRSSLLAVFSPADGGAPKLFIEGDHAVVTQAGATDRVYYSGTMVPAHLGAFIKIVSGKGSTQATNWRTITGMNSNDKYFTVSPPWNVAPDNTSEIAIYGLTPTGMPDLRLDFTEITGHPLTTTVTDVKVVDNIIYFAQGEDTAICAMQGYIDTAPAPDIWKWRWRLEVNAANKATFLEVIQNTEGKRQVWMARREAVTVASSDVKPYGTDLAFGTAIQCGDSNYRITGLQSYGEPRLPYVLKEDGIGAIKGTIFDQVPITEFEAVADDSNGRAHIQRGVYLYISMLNGIERYYENRLDDIGPNRDMGMPDNRTAPVSKLLAYPGRMYALIDNPNGYSAIMLYNNQGWHEIYRSAHGERAHDLIVQVLPGDACDRMYLSTDYGVKFFSVAIDPLKQKGYMYNTFGELTTSWISGGFKEVKKFWKSIKVFAEGLSGLDQVVYVYYQLDTKDNPWFAVPDVISAMPVDEALLSYNYDAAGTRIRFRVSLYTLSASKTPQIKAITVDSVLRLPVKRSWVITFMVSDTMTDLQGNRIPLRFSDVQAIMDRWGDPQQTPTPIQATYMHDSIGDHRRVFVDPLSFSPLEVSASDNQVPHTIKNICQLTLYEV